MTYRTITASQDQMIGRIKKYFEQQCVLNDLHKFEWKIDQETGKVLVEIETTPNILSCEGGLLQVGRRGKLDILIVFTLINKDQYAKWYQEGI